MKGTGVVLRGSSKRSGIGCTVILVLPSAAVQVLAASSAVSQFVMPVAQKGGSGNSVEGCYGIQRGVED